MKQVRAPMLLCEPVLTEVVYFLREDGLAVHPLLQLLEREAVRLDLTLPAHWPRIRTRMSRYRRMDLADASIVVMTELPAQSQVLTIARADFSVYRGNDRQRIDFVAPRTKKGPLTLPPDSNRRRCLRRFNTSCNYCFERWPGTELNRRRQPFQGCALPTELPGRRNRAVSP
jgi:hypothetical protein